MKPAILIGIMMLTLYAKGQDTPPQKIIFSYANGGNSFGEPGVYQKGEIVEMELNRNVYKVARIYDVVKSIARDSATRLSDTIWLNPSSYSTVAKRLIDSLLTQLKTTKDNFTVDFILPKLKMPSRDLIIYLAERSHNRYLLEGDEDKLDEERIDKYRNFEKLPEFVKKIKPNPEFYYGVVDAWNILEIRFQYANRTRIFRCNFTKPLGQPVYELIKESNFFPQVVNLEINTYLEAILPRNSMISKRVSIDSLTQDFVAWLFDPYSMR